MITHVMWEEGKVMKRATGIRSGFVWGVVCLCALSAPRTTWAYLYTLEPNGGVAQFFNNSAGTETEDNFVANSFTIVPGGTRLTAVNFLAGPGSITANQPATVAIYTASSLTDPHANGGLMPVATTTTTLAQEPAGPPMSYTITLNQPVDLAVGQVFYAGLLLPAIPAKLDPFGVDPFSTDLHRSFFDVGPTMGAAYNVDNTGNLTVLGGTHPVLGSGVQPAGNLVLTVAATPEPGGIAALAAVGACLLRRARRSTWTVR